MACVECEAQQVEISGEESINIVGSKHSPCENHDTVALCCTGCILVLTALSSGPEGAEREAAAACLASIGLLETVIEGDLTGLCGFPLTLSLPGASQN